MEAPKTPYKEVVDEENVEILGTLEKRSWAAFQEAWAEAVFFGLDVVQNGLVKSLRMTGSVGGEHRKDVVTVTQTAKQPTVALGVAPANGSTGAMTVEATPKRKWGL